MNALTIRLAVVAWLWLSMAVLPARAAELQPLRLAVHPYASTLTLVSTYRPVQQYLARTLDRPVEFYTAPNFDSFIDSLMAGEYDIVISPPHFALMAMETHYVPLLHYQTRLEPLLIVPTDSPIHGGGDFRGKRIAMADRTAFIRLVTIKWLADQGLVAGKDYQVVERPNHGAAISAAVMGEVDAGLATITALRQLPLDVQHKVRTIGTGLRFPHLFTLANRRLGASEIERVRQALLAFPATAEGRQFMEKSGFGDYEDISQSEIDSLRPYVDLYRQLEAH